MSLLARNPQFRYLWLGQVVSQLGDWFNTVAVYALLLDLTGSATAVASMMVVQFLPVALVGPVAGVLVDRLDRRSVMIAADLLRGLMILGLLLVRDSSQVWMAYVVMGVTVAATGFFEPARSSTIPALVARRDLVAANALGTATWSAMLAIGAALGGIVTAVIGREAAFLINSASFFASAAFIARIKPPSDAAPRAAREGASGLGDFLDGLRFLARNPPVAALAFVKAGWSLAGGALLLLTVYGERVFPIGGSAAAGIGVLYCARGIGAGFGALMLKRAFGARTRGNKDVSRVVAPAYFVSALFYVVLGLSPTIGVACIAVVGAHAAGGALWVASSVLLQTRVPDRYRGRVFAAELAVLTLAASTISYLTAVALDRWKYQPSTLAIAIGVAFAVPGLAWLLIQSRLRPAVDAAAEMPPVEDELAEARLG